MSSVYNRTEEETVSLWANHPVSIARKHPHSVITVFSRPGKEERDGKRRWGGREGTEKWGGKKKSQAHCKLEHAPCSHRVCSRVSARTEIVFNTNYTLFIWQTSASLISIKTSEKSLGAPLAGSPFRCNLFRILRENKADCLCQDPILLVGVLTSCSKFQ